ncbi:hypothetical protein BG023_112452 [Porphyrobacter sp. LM 6]|jgi:hypothetical protein|nr:hypothetical protein BG023_112452 [Porphyrobacter sp. LM 6]
MTRQVSDEGHRQSRWKRHIVFGLAFLAGFLVAASIYLILAIGECIPRDGSAQMHACDAIKRRDFWLYPLLFAATAGGSIAMHWRGVSLASLCAATSGLVAAVALMLANAYFA